MTRNLTCDFCGSEEVEWEYPALDFQIIEVRSLSLGYWAACDECHDLIEADKRPELLDRVFLSFPDQKLVPIPGLRSFLREVHARFFEQRTGPPIKAGTQVATVATTAETEELKQL